MTNETPMLTAAEVVRILAEHDREPALPCDGSPIVDGLQLRKRLGRKLWRVPEEHGCCGWSILGSASGHRTRIIVTGDHTSDTWPTLDGLDGNHWIHASIARAETMPSYDDLKMLHGAVFDTGWAYQVFAPPSDHVNIHAYALHLFGRADGARVLPDFGRFGTI